MDIDDVWTPFLSVKQRQKALVELGYDLGNFGPDNDGVDGSWGRASDAALLDFQETHSLFPNGHWTTFVCREVFKKLNDK